MKEDQVILVDQFDNQTGTMEKMKAHREAVLHRAVSVFLFNSRGEWLLQQRTHIKYHSKSLWSNTCCTHPYPGESNLNAAKRRLQEEMGIDCDLKEIFDFIYKEPLDSELTEYELDHVFIGISDAQPAINPKEVMDYKYLNYKDLYADLNKNPNTYTAWFRIIFDRVYDHFQKE
jgi:isopentenyl-diphosphate delta-isomerase